MKNKKEITKTILKGILLSGGMVVAATSPYFSTRILPKLIKYAVYKIRNKKDKKKFYDTFYSLKARGLVNVKYKGKQIYISLTEEGKKRAGKYQIDDLEIRKPRKWDRKWRILIFDISDKYKVKREALRGKLKELGIYQLQKSVWVCPYEFKKEIEILRVFLDLNNEEMKIIDAYKIEDDEKAKGFFGIK